MRVLVACEFSGIVRDAFIARGHDAISCDLLPTEMEGPHYQGDVRDLLGQQWDLMIAHPPCTHLAVSGARHFYRKQEQQEKALEFVRLLMQASIPRIAIENPVSIISTRIRKPDQIIQPYQFGHAAKKKTCLWLKNLPGLMVTCIYLNREDFELKVTRLNHISKWHRIRSRTFQGIADAMAEQWGTLQTP